MGKHRADAAPQTVAAAPVDPEPKETRSLTQRLFKNDWVWLVSFFLGFGTGLMLLYAGFLLYLTGDLSEWIRGLF